MTSEMTLSYRLFPSGDLVPGTAQAMYPLSGGAAMKLGAQITLYEAGGPPTNFTEYGFLFWDVNSMAFFGNQTPSSLTPEFGSASFTVPESAFQATAWYIGPLGGGGGPPKPIVTLSAFSLDQHKVLTPASPFVSVSVGSVSDLTTRTTTSAPAVTITPELVISPDGRFKSWFVYGGTGEVSASPQLTVPKGDGCAAIAFYGLTKLSPDPCQSILDKIASFPRVRPGQPLPQPLINLFNELAACQAQNGEPVFRPTTT